MPDPVVDANKCTGCGTCIEVCPMAVFELTDDKKADPVKASECIGCKACEVQCPVGAIVIND